MAAINGFLEIPEVFQQFLPNTCHKTLFLSGTWTCPPLVRPLLNPDYLTPAQEQGAYLAGSSLDLLRAWVQPHQLPHSPAFQKLFCPSTLCFHGIVSCIDQWVVLNRCVTWLVWRSEETRLRVQVTEMQVSVDFVHKDKNFVLCCWDHVASKREVILSKSC